MQNFKQLHHAANPILIGNVWDARSAICAEQAGYLALGTSSAAIANSLGYEDGENMPFEELLFIVKRIKASSQLPLSVDLEAGYSQNPEVIADHIQQLAKLGVVGINLEDSRVLATRTLVSVEEFSTILLEARRHLVERRVDIFINVRCDAFLLGLDGAVEEAKARAKAYESAGADGLFFPCARREEDIAELVAATSLPVNLMSMPELPGFDVLARIGVKRISTGNFAHEVIYSRLEQTLLKIKDEGCCAPLFT